MRSLIFILSTFTALPSFADPCSYLTRRECKVEREFCQYKPARIVKGICRATEGGINSICKQAHILENLGQDKVESECYSKMAITSCEWIPGQYEEDGCYMKESILRSLRR